MVRSICILFIYLALAGCLISPLLGPETHLPGLSGSETARVIYPSQQFSISELKAGRIPFWNPYIFCGTPHLANPASAVFYPPNLISLLVGVELGILLVAGLHLILICAGGYAFSRTLGVGRAGSLLGGIILGLGAPVSLRYGAGDLGALGVLAYSPALFACVITYVSKKSAFHLLSSMWLMALAFLAGDLPILLNSFCVLLVLLGVCALFEKERLMAINRSIEFVFVFLSGAVFLALFQIGPTIEFMNQTANIHPRPPIHFFPIENLLTLVVPDVWGDGVAAPYLGRFHIWQSSAYVGVVSLILLPAGWGTADRKIRTLGILSAVILAWACVPGLAGRLGRWFGLGESRGASELVFFALVFALPLFGRGLERLSRLSASDEDGETWVGGLWKGWFFCAGTLLFWVCVIEMTRGVPWSWVIRMIPETGVENKVIFDSTEYLGNLTSFENAARSATRSLMWAGLAIGLLTFQTRYSLRWSETHPAALVQALWIGLVVCDLLMFGRHSLMRTPPSQLAPPEHVVEAVRSKVGRDRIIVDDRLHQNMAMVHRIRTPGGESDLRLEHYESLVTDPLDDHRDRAVLLEAPVRTVNRTAVKAILSRSGRWGVLRPSQSLEGWYLVENPEGFSRLKLTRTQYSTIQAVPLEEGDSHVAPAVWLVDLPGRQQFETHDTRPLLLVLLDTFERNWRADIDQKSAVLLPTPTPFQSVLIPPGRHTIDLIYHPQMFIFCSAVSLVAMVILGGAWLREARRRLSGLPAS